MFAPYNPSALIVDDDAAVRISAAMLLAAMDIDAHLAENGEAALALVERRFFDFALIDLGLPDMDGAVLAEKLRAVVPAMSIIIVSGDHRCRAVREEGFADHWLDKPMSSKRLQQAIRDILTGGTAAPASMELGGLT